MSIIKKTIGTLSWTPPAWAAAVGTKKVLGLLLLGAVVAVASPYLIEYWKNRPGPPMVFATVTPPPITPIVNDKLMPQPLFVDFSVTRTVTNDADQSSGNSVARIDLLDHDLKDGVRIEPAIEGTWRWQSDSRLVFKPASDWPAGQQYRVTFEETLFADGFRFDTKTLAFTTLDFSATLDALDFYQDPVQKEQRKVVASLSFSHPVDTSDIQNLVKLYMRTPDQTVSTAAAELDYSLIYGPLNRSVHVHSETLRIPAKETYARLEVSEKLRAALGPGHLDENIQQQVRIPDVRSYFKIAHSSSMLVRDDDNNPQQTILIRFTDHVSSAALDKKLKLYSLPRSVMVNGKRQNKYYWESPREVTEEVLKEARRVDYMLNPVERDTALSHSLRIDANPGRMLYLRIEEGLESDSDFRLNIPYDAVLNTPDYPKEVSINRDGALLPLTGDHTLTFVSRGLNHLKVDVGRLLDSEINHLASQARGDISNPVFNSYQFDESNLVTSATRYIPLNSADPKKPNYASLDLSEFLPEGGYYFVTVTGWDAQNKHPIGQKDRRFVFITDLGFLVKTNADSTHDAYVHSIATGQPISGARVSIIGKNGIEIVSRTLNSDGHVAMPPTKDFSGEKEPVAFIVKHQGDSVFMPFQRNQRRLQYSRFDVGGDYYNANSNNRLRAQMFTDRSLYRPGDGINLAAIVKRENWQSLDNLPLLMEIRDARQQKIVERRVRLPSDGFLEFQHTTDLSSATGNYQATLFLLQRRNNRRMLGSTQFKVEEFQPDRLRIRSSISGQKAKGWIKPGDLYADVFLQNLFGTAAQDRRVLGELSLTPTRLYFADYKDYTFSDPLQSARSSIKTVRQPLGEQSTDKTGNARFALDLARYNQGIYQLQVLTEGFDVGGGRSVKSRASVMMSPMDFLVGYKQDTDFGFLKKDSTHSVSFVALDSDAQPYAPGEMNLIISEKRFVSTLVKRPNGTYAYQSVAKETERSRQKLVLDENGAIFNVPTTTAGRFVANLKGNDDRVYAKVAFTIVGERNLGGNLEQNAELDVNLNKKSYSPGEMIELEITAPYTGTGLITIERERVLHHQWFDASSKTSVQRIRIPQDLEGNAYVNVAFIRDINSPEIYISPLSYAVVPFSIDLSARTLKVDLSAPELVTPGEKLDIAYSTSRPARIVVYAVDEGILQVARYKLPDPLDFFMRKIALGVSTFQLVDLILPAFESAASRAAPGGGEAAGIAGSNLNPFQRKTDKPVVFWSGIVDAGPDSKVLSYAVPDYFNGQLRVMAVAVSDNAVGNAKRETLVRAPFVITPAVLTSAAPGDEFDVTVSISNNVDGSGEDLPIALTATVSEHLELVASAEASLTISESDEAKHSFKVRAKNRLGSARIKIAASGGGKTSSRDVSLSIRPATPRIASVIAGSTDKDSFAIAIERNLYDEYADSSLAASASPLVLAEGMLGYLETFEHQCAEQIVSKVFPQLGFLGVEDFSIDAAAIERQFANTISKLRSRQLPTGGFRFWASSSEAADFPSVYITHFLTDAKDKGLAVPEDMLRSALAYVAQLAGAPVNKNPQLAPYRLRAYAIYILTRNAQVTTSYLTSLHEQLETEHPTTWRQDLTAAYIAAGYMMLKNSDLGLPLMKNYQPNQGEQFVSDFDTQLGRDAQHIYLLARHFPGLLNNVSADQIQALIDPILQNRFNTLSASYSVMALNAYTRQRQAGERALVSIADTTGSSQTTLVEKVFFARTQIANAQRQLQVSRSADAAIFYSLAQSGFDLHPSSDPVSAGIEIDRVYLDASGTVVTQATIGEELTVRLRLRSTGRTRSNVAVVDLLPGGFEILTDSVSRTSGNNWYDYLDVREDRLVVYATVGNQPRELAYTVKATSSGSFVIPAATAKSMYDRTVHAQTGAGRFSVRAVQ